MSLNHSPAIVTDGLVLCLDAANVRSYPKSGTTWSDLAGANNGTMENMTSANYSSDNGGVISFDGSNDYVDISVSEINSIISDSITIETFVRSTNTAAYQVIGGGQDTTSARYSMSFNVGNFSYSGKFGFDLEASSGQVRLNSSSSFSNNTWVHLIGTYDGAIARFYINGVLEDSDSGTSGSVVSLDGFIIGRDIELSAGRVLSGAISYYRMYNRALSADEVRRNYEATVGRYT